VPLRDRARRWATVPILLFAFTLGALLPVQEAGISGNDGQNVFEVTKSIVDRGDVTMHNGSGVVGHDGQRYNRAGVGQPLVGIPAYLASKALPTSNPRVAESLTAATMALITALLAVVIYRLGLAVGASPPSAVAAALAGVFGTFILVYSKDYFGELLTALLVAIAIERLARIGHPSRLPALWCSQA